MPVFIERRSLLAGLGLAGLGALASCRSLLPAVDGAGASAAAAATLAGIRAGEGVGAVSADRDLEQAAARQAGYMVVAGRMEHTALPGRDFVSRMHASGIAGPAAENLAHGRMDIERLFSIWMGSPPHRRNMLDPRFDRFGLAYAGDGDGSRYWSLVLAA